MRQFALLDLALERARNDPKYAEEAAGICALLIDLLVQEAQLIRELDAYSLAPDRLVYDRACTVVLRVLCEEWARDADAALKRIAPLYREGFAVGGYERLGHEFGRVMARLSVTIESNDHAREQMRSGQSRRYTVEQLRNELRQQRQVVEGGEDY